MISLQEHFLMSRSLNKISELLPEDLCVHSVAAFKEGEIRRGRGKGGLSMIWPKCFMMALAEKSKNPLLDQCLTLG